MNRIPVLLLLAITIPGCASLPRGAALQGEVLNVARDDSGRTTEVPDFQVAPVTRDTLDIYARWPRVGDAPLPWIDRVRQPTNRLIRTGDTLKIIIWDPTGSGILTDPGKRSVELPPMEVSSTGRVFLPYVGDVRVAGMGVDHARSALEEKFAEASGSVQVQIQHIPGRQSSVSLVGGVARPGTYPMPDQDYTLLNLLADGGGVQTALNGGVVRLHRGGTVYGLDVEELYETPARNTTLIGGDQVIVSADDRVFMSLGAAGRESRHDFPAGRLTAIEAISIAGGVQDSRADPGGVLVLRTYPQTAVGRAGPQQQRVVFTMDLTHADGLFSAQQFEIMPDDLIYVTEAPVLRAQSIVGILGSALGFARAVRSY